MEQLPGYAVGTLAGLSHPVSGLDHVLAGRAVTRAGRHVGDVTVLADGHQSPSKSMSCVARGSPCAAIAIEPMRTNSTPSATSAARISRAVDDYLAECEERGLPPEKPVSGKMLLRVPPEIHGKALVVAKAAGKSLNQWATEVLRRAVQPGE